MPERGALRLSGTTQVSPDTGHMVLGAMDSADGPGRFWSGAK